MESKARMLNWFKSYLSDRQQYVVLGNTNSEMRHVPCGVPQGSVLGHILFLIYINDFHHCSKLLDFHIFADDTNLFCSDKSLINLEYALNEQLKLVGNWLWSNKLSLNVEKTNFVIFHCRQKRTNT